MAKIRIMFSRYSAFYSPLVATEAGGFLAAEGLEAEFSVAGAGAAPRARIADGSIELIQSAPSASRTPPTSWYGGCYPKEDRAVAEPGAAFEDQTDEAIARLKQVLAE